MWLLEYISISWIIKLKVNFNKFCVFWVWGGKIKGKGMELFNEMEFVDYEVWEEYKLLLEFFDIYDYIYLEVYYYYGGDEIFFYNGNLMVDYCFLIVFCDIVDLEDDLY